MIEISEDLRRALGSRPVLAQGQADDLVIEARPAFGLPIRVWLSRVDGTVSVETQGFSGQWVTLDGYEEREQFRLALLETVGSEWEGSIW